MAWAGRLVCTGGGPSARGQTTATTAAFRPVEPVCCCLSMVTLCTVVALLPAGAAEAARPSAKSSRTWRSRRLQHPKVLNRHHNSGSSSSSSQQCHHQPLPLQCTANERPAAGSCDQYSFSESRSARVHHQQHPAAARPQSEAFQEAQLSTPMQRSKPAAITVTSLPGGGSPDVSSATCCAATQSGPPLNQVGDQPGQQHDQQDQQQYIVVPASDVLWTQLSTPATSAAAPRSLLLGCEAADLTAIETVNQVRGRGGGVGRGRCEVLIGPILIPGPILAAQAWLQVMSC